jgi:aryl-alcohol dehydrogenase-like predicted oxidoreductase
VVQRKTDDASGVRRLGFGVSGPHGSLLVPSSHTVAMVRRAFELGIRLFDTGPSYGNGEAERRLGEALSGLPRWQCIVATKAGITASGINNRTRDFSPDAIRRSIDGSLKRLRLQRLDWLILHGPAASELSDDLLKMLVELRFSGVIGALGVAGYGPEMDAAVKTDVFNMFMTPVHAALKQPDLDRLTALKSKGAELVGIEALAPAHNKTPLPLLGGSGDTWRFFKTLFGRGRDVENLGMSHAEALIWSLTQGGAHRVVMSTTKFHHLEYNVAAARAAPSSRLLGGPA